MRQIVYRCNFYFAVVTVLHKPVAAPGPLGQAVQRQQLPVMLCKVRTANTGQQVAAWRA